MRLTPVLLLFALLALLPSCKDRPPFPEEYSDNADLLYNITIIKEPKIVSLANIDGKIEASIFERNKDNSQSLTF